MDTKERAAQDAIFGEAIYDRRHDPGKVSAREEGENVDRDNERVCIGCNPDIPNIAKDGIETSMVQCRGEREQEWIRVDGIDREPRLQEESSVIEGAGTNI
jgi:hypothetical protein